MSAFALPYNPMIARKGKTFSKPLALFLTAYSLSSGVGTLNGRP